MSFQREFAEILKEKMGSPQESTPEKPSNLGPFSYEERFEPFISAPHFSFSPSQFSNQYPRSKVVKTDAKAVQPPPQKPEKVKIQEKSYKIGELGMDMATPFVTLIRLGAKLDEKAITLSALKREYRKLAKRYHPDHSKREDAVKLFQSCCQSYGQIKQALNSLSNN